MWKLKWNLFLVICIAFWFVLIQHNFTFTWKPKFCSLYWTTMQVLRFSSHCGWRLHSSEIKSCVIGFMVSNTKTFIEVSLMQPIRMKYKICSIFGIYWLCICKKLTATSIVKIHLHLIKLHEMKMYGEQIYNSTFHNLSQQPIHPTIYP
jgi:hypothetical protein